MPARLIATASVTASRFSATKRRTLDSGISDRIKAGAKARADYQKDHHATSPTAYLQSLGVLGPNVCLAHVLGIDDAEIDLMARTGTRAAMCPVTAAEGARGV